MTAVVNNSTSSYVASFHQLFSISLDIFIVYDYEGKGGDDSGSNCYFFSSIVSLWGPEKGGQ